MEKEKVMDDLISRQAVLDALKDAINDSVVLTIQGYMYSHDDNYFGLEVALSLIQNLPSAQPDIIRCGECSHKDKKIDYCHYLGITICERDYCSYAERRTDG